MSKKTDGDKSHQVESHVFLPVDGNNTWATVRKYFVFDNQPFNSLAGVLFVNTISSQTIMR